MEENLWWEVFFNSQETEDMIMAVYAARLLDDRGSVRTSY